MTFKYLSTFSVWFGFLMSMFSSEEAAQTVDTSSKAPAIIQEVNPVKQAFIADFDAQAKQLLRRIGQPGAAIAIVMDSTVVYTEGLGYRNRKTKELVNENSVFRVGSLSKGFASVLTAVLVEEESLNWDDKVKEYLPDFILGDSVHTNELEIKHILSHTSGLPYHAYTDMLEKRSSIERIKEKLGGLKLIGDPGEVYSYQNAGYSWIEDIVQSATGRSYNQLLDNKIFGPIGMEDASTSREDIRNCDNASLPHYYSKKRGWRPTKISSKYYNATSAGGVNASVSDMSKWLQLLMGQHDEVISDEVLNEVFTPIVNTKNRKKYYQRWKGIRNAHYALGWRILDKKNSPGEYVYHGGYVNQYRSELLYNRNDNVAICILSNAPTSFASKCAREFIKLYDTYRDDIQLWDELNQPQTIIDKIQS